MGIGVKNIDSVSHTWGGQAISSGSTFICPTTNESVRIANDSNFIVDFSAAKAEVYLDAIKISDIATALSLLNGFGQKDSEGANLALTKLAPTGWTYKMYCWEIVTSVSGGGAYHFSKNGVIDNSFLTYAMYSSVSGYGSVDLTTDPSIAVKTVVDFEPTHDYRIIKGQLFQKSVPTDDVYFNLIGVPDIPYAYGGSRELVEGLDLTFLTNGRPIESDGKVPKFLQYSPIYHTNKLRTIVYHNPGHIHKIMMAFEFYRP